MIKIFGFKVVALFDGFYSSCAACAGHHKISFLLENLPLEWFDYVDFHLATVGCHFCRASFKDLQERQNGHEQERFQQRIMTSTVGFLSKP